MAGGVALRYVYPAHDYGLNTFVGPLDGYAKPATGYLEQQVGPQYSFYAGFVVLGLVVVLVVLWLFLPVFAAWLFAGLRRLQREKALRGLAREGDAGSGRYLEALREAVDERFEDVGLHLKYAEALYARGMIVEAAAECRLLLRQDPYNFAGGLLLANAYLALGMKRECVALCDWYLEISGYGFEFAELREQGLRRAV
jgi:hypothetical protein